MSWSYFKPARTLNQTTINVHGLTMYDFMSLVILIAVLQPLCDYVFEVSILWAFGFVGILAMFLARIRQKYRRRIIRDYLIYMQRKIFFRGVCSEAKSNRSKTNRKA